MMERMVTLLATCPHCGKEKFITVEEEKLNAWISGELIQNVWPEKSPQEREEIRSGFCAKCWSELFGAFEKGTEE